MSLDEQRLSRDRIIGQIYFINDYRWHIYGR
jgi:hypothetical protein